MPEKGFATSDPKSAGTVFFSVLLFPIPLLTLHFSIWGWSDFVGALLDEGLILIPAFILGLFAHECLHFLFLWLIGKAEFKHLRFSFDRSTLSPFVSCKQDVTVSAFLWVQLAPLLILALPPAAYALISGSDTFAIWSALMISGCASDVTASFMVRKIPMKARLFPELINENDVWGYGWSMEPPVAARR